MNSGRALPALIQDVGLNFPGLDRLSLATAIGTAQVTCVLYDRAGVDLIASTATGATERAIVFEVTLSGGRFQTLLTDALITGAMNPEAVGARLYIENADVYWNWGGLPDNDTVPTPFIPVAGVDGKLSAGNTYIIGRGAQSSVCISTPQGTGSGNSELSVSGVDLERICLIADVPTCAVGVEFFDFDGKTTFQGTITVTSTACSLRYLYEAVGPGTYDPWSTTYASVLIRSKAAGNIYYNFGGNGLADANGVSPYGVTATFAPTVAGTYTSPLTTGLRLGTYFGA